MSSALALAAVSACVRDLIQNRLTSGGAGGIVGPFRVTTRPPDRVLGTAAEDPTQVNWYLHRVSPNPGWVNRDLPSRDGSGARVGAIALALNLHYVLTVFAARELHAEILLGHAMQALHETPMLGRDAIRRSLSPAVPPPDFPVELATAGLAEQVEAIKLTLVPTQDEAGRFWAAVNSHYRTSAYYEATVVLIESRRAARPSLPVTRRIVQVLPSNRPQIDDVRAASGEDDPITPAATLRISGTRLMADDTRLFLNGIDVTSATTLVGPEEILQPLTPLPAGLRAGIGAVQVAHRINLGDPPAPRGGIDSNAVAWMLRPEIVPGVPAITASRVVDGVTFRTGTLSVNITPAVTARQPVILLFNETNPPAGRAARGYSFPAPDANGIVAPAMDTAAITFTFTDVAAGNYLLRVSVSGADSVLGTDASGRFANPEVTI
jgi:hypothetical protein